MFVQKKCLPLVSLVTPSFNQGQFLEETILSVLRQDYPNMEYIIIDGGSTDDSVNIIKKYQDELSYWISEPDQGQTDAIIKGFGRAKGEFINWLCADDLIEPSMISLSVWFLQKYLDIGLTFGNRVRIDEKGNIYSLQRYSQLRGWYLKFGLTLPQETVLFRRSLYEKSGGLDRNLFVPMDYDLWCKMWKYAKFYHIPTFLGRFRAHSQNKSTAFSAQVKDSSFSEGIPSEFSDVMFRHFGKRPSKNKMKLGSYFRSAHGFIERRSRYYQEAMREISKIRTRNNNI